MFLNTNIKAQAASELAVFGAILIFVLGSIVRVAVSNSFQQNHDFQTMRQALLLSWQNSSPKPNFNISHNQSSIIILEDRLSPDPGKYGPLDRVPMSASGSGSFSYEMFYPLDPEEIGPNLPIMDLFINGQHFPLTTASYDNKVVCQPGVNGCPDCDGTTAQPPSVPRDACLQNCNDPDPMRLQECQLNCQNLFYKQCTLNQCLRNKREWVGGLVFATQFKGIVPLTQATLSSNCAASTTPWACQDDANAIQIFERLQAAGTGFPGTGFIHEVSVPGIGAYGYTGSGVNDLQLSTSYSGSSAGYSFAEGSVGAGEWAAFTQTYATYVQTYTPAELRAIAGTLKRSSIHYKLFYAIQARGGDTFTQNPPAACSGDSCINQALDTRIMTLNASGQMCSWNGPSINNCGGGQNHTGDMMFDLTRMGDYQQVEDQMGSPTQDCSAAPSNARCNVSWEWSATLATSESSIGLDRSKDTYPYYDVNGSLKEGQVINLSLASDGTPIVGYENFGGGDIDSGWDQNSCGPKPGLQPEAQIFSFSKDGTYLEIKEGKMFNPQTGEVVNSVNKRNTIDLIQRVIQLSNNTGRFCSVPAPGQHSQICTTACYATRTACESGCGGNNACIQTCDTAYQNCWSGCANPNPVEVCVDGSDCPSGPHCNCYSTQTNLKSTCYDIILNKIFVRSRLEDRRGVNWSTNASGKLKVQ